MMKSNFLAVFAIFVFFFTITSCSKDSTKIHPVDQALQQGDASLIADDQVPELLSRMVNKIDADLQKNSDIVDAIFGTQAIDYQVGNRVALFELDSSRNNIPLIVGSDSAHTMAFAGELGEGRYAAFNTGIVAKFQAQETSLAWLEDPFKRLLSWLFKRPSFEGSDLNKNKMQVALSHFNSVNETNNINWLSAQFDQWEFTPCNDGPALAACYKDKDLILVGWEGGDDNEAEDTGNALKILLQAGTPVLYLHSDIEYTTPLTEKVADVLGATIPYGGNFWANDVAIWDNANQMTTSINNNSEIALIRKPVQHFIDNDFSIEWGECENNCENNETYTSEFKAGVDLLKASLDNLESQNIKLFEESGYELEKLAVLLADKFREDVTFPMDKLTTNSNEFMKSHFADHLVYYGRSVAKAQPDMGNFSRSDFSHITAANKTVDFTSHDGFRAAGVYALPGKTLTVTRNDTSDVNVEVFVNSIRAGSTHAFSTNGYNRPKFVQSRHFSIANGETISFISPYGGPVQVSFDAKGEAVQLKFQNIGEHPYWNAAISDEAFIAKLAANDFDWAEISTPYFEIHSTQSKMLQTMERSYWLDSPSILSTYINTYVHDYPRALAGLKGDGITPIVEVDTFVSQKGWTLDENEVVKHMNADQPLCGYGCAGNPYDAGWYFSQSGSDSPVGHGDVHEVGHELEGSMRFDGWDSHSSTNYYVFYSKSKVFQEKGETHGCFGLPFQNLFNILQTSVGEPDPAAYIKANLWDVNQWGDGAGMMLQIMMASQAQGTLVDGWNVRALLHAMEREFNRAKTDEAIWLSKRDLLGFSTYTHAEAAEMSNNDWLTIALSYVTQRDMRDYLAMWAIPYSIKADQQVAAFNYAAMPRTFFASGDSQFCETLNHTPVTIDGVSGWSVAE